MVAVLTKQAPPFIGKNGKQRGDGGGSFRESRFAGEEVGQLGVLFFMATVTMLFAGTISALVIRRASPDWQPIYLPGLLWANTGILFLSSITLELSRDALKSLRIFHGRIWMTLTTFFGFIFLVGQVMAWREMASHGVFLPSSPHASFFYLLTGLHGIHLLAGVLVLGLACGKAWSGISPEAQLRFLKGGAMYWHYLDGLWLFLFVILFIL